MEPSFEIMERVVRRHPSPLVMKKRRVTLEDGRTLIYYEFSRPEQGEATADPEAIHLIPGRIVDRGWDWP